MDDFFTYLLIAFLCWGYLVAFLYYSICGQSSAWWEPIILPVAMPCLWLYVNRVPIIATILLLAAVIGLPLLIGEVCGFVGGFIGRQS